VLKNAEQFTRLELSANSIRVRTAIQSLVGGKDVPGVRLPVRSVQKFETEARPALAELAEVSKTHEVTVFSVRTKAKPSASTNSCGMSRRG